MNKTKQQRILEMCIASTNAAHKKTAHIAPKWNERVIVNRHTGTTDRKTVTAAEAEALNTLLPDWAELSLGVLPREVLTDTHTHK